MKTIVRFIALLLVMSFSLCSCSNSTQEESKFQLEEGYEYVHLIPDSLRTLEQQELLLLIRETAVANLKVKDNHLAFSLSEDDFINKGIPKQYYELLQHNIKEANLLIDSEGLTNMDSILRESYKGFYQSK